MAIKKTTIVILGIVLVVVAIGVLAYAYRVKQQDEQAALSNLNGTNQTITNIVTPFVPMKTSILGCAQTRQEVATKGSDETASQSPTVSVTGKTFTYSHVLSHACCKTAIIKHKSTSSSIDITEYWQGEPCKCSCSSTLKATAPFIPSGAYDVTVYQQGSSTVSDGQDEQPKIILQKKIVVD